MIAIARAVLEARGSLGRAKGPHLEAERRREVHRTVAEEERPAATSWPMVPSTSALGASRLGWLSSSPNTLYLPAQGVLIRQQEKAVHQR